MCTDILEKCTCGHTERVQNACPALLSNGHVRCSSVQTGERNLTRKCFDCGGDNSKSQQPSSGDQRFPSNGCGGQGYGSQGGYHSGSHGGSHGGHQNHHQSSHHGEVKRIGHNSFGRDDQPAHIHSGKRQQSNNWDGDPSENNRGGSYYGGGQHQYQGGYDRNYYDHGSRNYFH